MLFLDNICNEYSVFYINDTQFPISNTYQIIENHIVQIIEYIINYLEILFNLVLEILKRMSFLIFLKILNYLILN
jgi:hypothetical protein